MKSENSGLFAWEIRDQLMAQQICDAATIPSISSINRILRNAGEQYKTKVHTAQIFGISPVYIKIR
jgi:hypothetical protein